MSNQTHQLSDFDEDQMDDLRRGPWTLEEDFLLVNYITNHGEGRWNSLARSAGLKRTGKSCRLRWLNYLRPDVRRGNITLEEQLLILELHSRWGNRWSKIAQHLPGRTDNEIKNYWRTRVQKHAKQLQCDVNSKQFKDTMRYLWMPRLVERIQAASASAYSSDAATTTTNHNHHQNQNQNQYSNSIINSHGHLPPNTNTDYSAGSNWNQNLITTPENSSTAGSSDSMGTQFSSDYSYNFQTNTSSTLNLDNTQTTHNNNISESLFSPYGYYNQGGGMELQGNNNVEQNSMWGGDHGGGEDISGNLWNDEDIWFLQQQLYDGI